MKLPTAPPQLALVSTCCTPQSLLHASPPVAAAPLISARLCDTANVAASTASSPNKVVSDKISRSDWTSNMVVTYEPLWAVGPDALKVASAVQAQDMHSEIRKWVARTASDEAAAAIRIIYGGSINKGNCEKMIKAKDIDGFMIGSASLRPHWTACICC